MSQGEVIGFLKAVSSPDHEVAFTKVVESE